MKVPRSAVFSKELEHALIKRSGFAFKYNKCYLPGLTKKKDGLLRPRFYPYFDRKKAKPIGLVDRGVGLKWKGAAAMKRNEPSSRAISMQRRMGMGMKRGNDMNKHVASMVWMMHRFAVPLVQFSASYRATRKPKVMTLKRLTKDFPKFSEDDQMAKQCLSAMNTTQPHFPLLAQKILELEIDLDGYEVPYAHSGVGLAPEDLTGIHRPTKARTNIETKTSNGGYLFDVHGTLEAPYSSIPNCVMNQWQLQLAYTNDWAKRSHPHLASRLSVPLLIVVSPRDCKHYPLRPEFRNPPPLG